MKVRISFFFSLFFSFSAAAESYADFINNPQTVGQATMKVMFLNIYDVELVASDGEWSQNQPFALKLTYFRKFDGESIASRSIDEIRDLGMDDEIKLALWFEKMHSIFPDVQKGSVITGVADSKGVSHFYYKDQQKLGSVDDPEFTKWFFSIWLHEDTSEPEMRKKLLGLEES